jgi:hypothetical protein
MSTAVPYLRWVARTRQVKQARWEYTGGTRAGGGGGGGGSGAARARGAHSVPTTISGGR